MSEKKRLCIELCMVLASMAFGLAILYFSGAVTRLDDRIEEVVMSFRERPVDSRLLIVSIDDKSIDAIGRWPWPRSVHVELLSKMVSEPPAYLSFDVLMSEMSNALHDAELRSAISQLPHVVLPVAHSIGSDGADKRILAPADSLIDESTKLVSIDVELDERGIIRQLPSVTHEGLNGLAYDAAGFIGSKEHSDVDRFSFVQHGSSFPLAYAGPSGQVPMVSYIDILLGVYPADFLAGKVILIGALGTGLGDRFPTPGGYVLSGVEIHAQAIDGLLQGISYTRLEPWAGTLSAVCAVLFVLGIFVLVRWKRVFSICAACILVLLALTVFVAAKFGFYLPPSMSVIALGLVYPIMAWRRIHWVEALSGHQTSDILHRRLDRSQRLNFQTAGDNLGGFLLSRFQRYQYLVSEIDSSEALYSAALEAHPCPVVIVDSSLHVVRVSAAGRRRFGLMEGMSAEKVLVMSEAQCLSDTPSSLVVELWVDEQHRVYERLFHEIKLPVSTPENNLYQFIFMDITEQIENQKSREQTIRFLSHDLRSPQSSIVALSRNLQLKADNRDAELTDELRQIEDCARLTINLAESFLLEYSLDDKKRQGFQEIEVCNLVYELSFNMQPIAKSFSRQLRFNHPDSLFYVLFDYQLLYRAIQNLVENSLKYSGESDVVEISIQTCIRADKNMLMLCVDDRGPGLSSDFGLQLSQNTRLDTTQLNSFGLGLQFVKRTCSRADGALEWGESPLGGARFAIIIPLHHREDL